MNQTCRTLLEKQGRAHKSCTPMDPHICGALHARTYIQQLCEDTGCSPEDLPEAMNDREKWLERVRDIRASGTTWWWWYIRGEFNNFPDFFVLAFKIVDSRNFSMILLYILWDDWPTFMISHLNEQLQQELEYTLHSWWISKRQSGCEDTLEERYAIKLCFKLGKMPQKRSECFRLILEHLAWIKHQFFVWYKRFKEGRESVREDERCGRIKEVNRPELIG